MLSWRRSPSSFAPNPGADMMFPNLLRQSLQGLAAIGLCSAAFADVIYVDAFGHGSFISIQPAIDAAVDGDVILVRSGPYGAFTLDQRSLSVIADADAIVKVSGAVTITNTPSNAMVLIAGLDVSSWPSQAPTAAALNIAANAGHVRVQGCTLRGGDGVGGGPIGGNGSYGAFVTTSAEVAFASCTFRGGTGYGEDFFGPDGGAGGGGFGCRGSAVALYDCVCVGGTGGISDYAAGTTAGAGGNGCTVFDYGILASGCSFTGGTGGGLSAQPGRGGDGLAVILGAQAQLIDNTTVGGQGGFGYYGNFGPNGLPESGGGVFHHIAGKRRKVSAAFLAAETSSIQVALSGEPGDRFWLLSSSVPAFVYVPSYAGMLLIPAPFFMTSSPMTVLPASGTANVTLRMPSVGSGVSVARRIWQGLAMSATGVTRLGSPIHVLVLNCSDLAPDCNANGACDSCDLLLATSLDCDHNGIPDDCQPDCNANGVADACDLASGSSLDLNHNGIPDECEPQTDWYVDASAPHGGNGSAVAPFRTLGEAFTRAISGDTMLVANGLYQGPGNRNLDFGNRNLVVASSGGATNCIIDCELLGRAFVAAGGVSSAARIDGFTIRNGRRTGTNAEGGGMRIKNSSPTIRACVFENCESSSNGGAVSLEQSSTLIAGCTFDGNKALSGYGGAVSISGGASPRVLDSRFTNDRALSGGALLSSLTSSSIERCEFLANTAVQSGGAIYAEASMLIVDQCCLAGNNGKSGGAVATYRSAWRLLNCTVVDNAATTTAGAFYFVTSSLPITAQVWRNDLFRNNTAPTGTPIHLQWATLDVASCNLQGGQSSITVGASGNVFWGPGNLDLDPLFVDADGPDNNPLTFGDNDYRLALSSPCVDSGDNTAVALDVFDLDLDGNTSEPVPFDLDGNARFFDIPSAPNTGVGPPPIVDMGPWERQP